MTNEELMMPRYEVIADYPGNKYEVGTIFTYFREVAQAYSLWKDDQGNEMYSLSFSKYPHLFKRLAWWENRRPEDMPGYVKWKRSAGDYVYCRVLHPSKDCREFGHEDDTVEHRFVFKGGYELATKEEYETYLSNKHKQKK